MFLPTKRKVVILTIFNSSERSSCLGGTAVTLKSQKTSANAAQEDGAKRAFK
jgi:hypothetical protein